MKSTKIFITFFILVVFFSSCNLKPIQQLPPDTVRIVDKQIHYQIEKIVHDSIITKTDTFANFIFRDKIIYQTKSVTISDTIVKNKEVIKTNPVNEELKKGFEKSAKWNKIYLKIILGLILAIISLYFGFKLFK